jgi:ATP-binding protein involved in chromosome partitioning
MSMAFLVKPEEAIVWRGPMLHGAVNQLLRETNWGELDFLIVDMPPGTGDVALTLSQLVPVSGAVVVCTPQQVALIDAIRAVSMFNNLEIPVLGMVENMSGYICPHCRNRSDLFGSGGARQKAEHWDVPFLGEIPLNVQLQQQSDTGNLADALANPICSEAMHTVAINLVRNLSQRAAINPIRPTLPVL